MPVNLGKPGERMDYLTRYLIEEEIEEFQMNHISRREMVKRVLIITGSVPATASILLAAGCGASPTATPAASAAPSAAASTSAAPGECGGECGTECGTSAAASAAAAAATPAASAAASAAASPTRAASPSTAAPSAGSPVAGSPVATRNPVTVPATDPAIEAAAVTYPGQAGQLMGYLAAPRATTKVPGIIVIHENRGLNEHIRDVARRYAKSGFVALAIDLLSRQGGTDKVDQAQVPNLLSTADRAATIADMVSSVAFLKTHAKFAGPKAGVVGYCFGGGMCWLLAVSSPDIGASNPYYGPPPDPIDLIKNLAGPVLAFYGATDTRINANIDPIEAAIKQYGKTFTKEIYAGAGHAFNNDTGTAYNEAAAKDAYTKSVAFFQTNLK
ncbi:MAG: dienelactone hydrolase family protein [Chloroflexia bacterium]